MGGPKLVLWVSRMKVKDLSKKPQRPLKPKPVVAVELELSGKDFGEGLEEVGSGDEN